MGRAEGFRYRIQVGVLLRLDVFMGFSRIWVLGLADRKKAVHKHRSSAT